MANVSLKTDFKDGEKLFAVQLNNNFAAIEAALSAANQIVWQDNTADVLTYFKGTTAQVAARGKKEGQLLYDYEAGKAYIDHNNTRLDIISGSAIAIVVNNLDGDQTNRSPSVHAVKQALSSLQGRITYGTSAPSGGSDGDIYLKYDA